LSAKDLGFGVFGALNQAFSNSGQTMTVCVVEGHPGAPNVLVLSTDELRAHVQKFQSSDISKV
jgi:hypothetical protein